MSGIQSSQEVASSDGTKSRDNIHNSSSKVRRYGTVIVILFLSLYLWRSSSESETTTTGAAEIFYKKTQQAIYLDVDFMRMQHGDSLTIPMGLSSIAILKIPGTMVGKDEHGNYGCPEAAKLNGLFPVMFEVPHGNRTSNVQLKLTDETKKKLAELNVVSVDVTFTLTKGPMFGVSPCKFVK